MTAALNTSFKASSVLNSTSGAPFFASKSSALTSEPWATASLTVQPSLQCGKTNGTCVRNASFKLTLGKWLFLLALMLNVALVSADDEAAPLAAFIDQQTNITVVMNVDDALINHFETYGATNETDQGYYIATENIFVSDITYPKNATDFVPAKGLSKRWDANNAPLGTWFHQWQVARQGIWHTDWKPASGCQWNFKGGDSQYSMSWSQTQTESLSAGFNFDFGKAAAFSLGVTIEHSKTEASTRTCSIKQQDEVGRIFTRKEMVWQDQQKQLCVRKHYGKNGLHCNAWSEYIHGDVPTQMPFDTGCSLGKGWNSWCW